MEGVRIAVRSRSLSIEKSRRELGYAPNPLGPALSEAIASLMSKTSSDMATG
jgi:dihydroflavonol-4-reductase